MTMRRYPLGRRFLVSRHAGREARRIRLLAGTSDWRRDVLDRTGAAAILLAGTRPWPRSTRWTWPDLDAAELEAALAELLPGLRIVAVALPRQPDRARLSALCSDGRDVVVKLGVHDHGLEREAAALRLLTDNPLPGIATPRLLATGRLDGISVLATEALGLDRQRPAIGERLASFERDLAERLAELPRPPGTANDAVPVHGDLTPWNLRRTGRGLALFDWEAAGWGPAGSDLELYEWSSAQLRGRAVRGRRR